MIRKLNGDEKGAQNLLKQYFGFTKNHIKVATTIKKQPGVSGIYTS